MAVQVVGAGLAGSEAAWQIAQAGLEVTLWEMRPVQSTPAHHSPHFAELVCSNSFGAIASDRAAGLLKEELRRLGSVVIDTALAHAVPAGGALAVDRATFSAAVTERVSQHPKITVQRQELTALPDEPTVLCTGPLTSASLAAALQSLTGLDYLSFYDAASPIVTGESLDRDIAFLASRYDRGEAAYLNCPLNEAEYQAFWQALVTAEQAPLKDFEADRTFFEGCLPLEEMARRGEDTLRFGPLKPVGLIDPRTGQEPYACVQLRQEDRHGRLWNLVGFQTNLKWGEQQRVFRLIPGLAAAEFVRLGVMHRNTFLNAPQVIDATLQLRQVPHYFAAGQLVGTEGYACAVAGGWLAGTNMARYLHGLPLWTLPTTTMMGALFNFVSTADAKHFQPMPANFGLLPNLDGKKVRRKQDRYGLYRDRALAALVPFGAVETPTISDGVSAVA